MFHQDHGQRTQQTHPEYNVNSITFSLITQATWPRNL